MSCNCTLSKAYSYLAGRRYEQAQKDRIGWELGGDPDSFAVSSTFGGVSFLGTTVLLPGDADTYMRETESQLEAVAADVLAHRQELPSDYLTSWDAFAEQWKTFYTKHYGDWNLLDGGRGLMAEVDVFVQRLQGFQQKMVALKVTPNAPGVVADPNSTQAPARPLSNVELAVAGLAIAGVGGALLLRRR